MKPKRSKADRLAFAKRMTRRFCSGIHCYKIGPHQYFVKRRGWSFDSFKISGYGRTALEAWESALRQYIAGVLSSMYWRGTIDKVAELKTVYFGFGEAAAQVIKDAPDWEIVGIDEWIADTKKAPAITGASVVPWVIHNVQEIRKPGLAE